jgi:hypothetical protein
MQSARHILATVVQLVATALITILIDRWVSTRAAIIALCACLVMVGYLHWTEIEPLYQGVLSWGRQNRIIAIAICGALGAAFGVGLAWVITRPAAHVVHNADDIKPLLSRVQDPTYRDLVAEVIHELSPTSRVSVGTLITTPDGTRTVDVEVTSIEKKSFITDIDVVDLPSGRPAGVEVVDAADSKSPDIKADAMLVCSNTGFDAVAIRKAKRKKIGLISVLRQGDERVRAVIEEEIYLRKVDISPAKIDYTEATPQDRETLRELWRGTHEVTYQGGSVDAWLEDQALAIVASNPFVDQPLTATFQLKNPTDFDIKGRRVKLKALKIRFQPRIQWLSQTVQLDAGSGIYDYVRGRVRLAGNGKQSFVIEGIDFDQATPLASPPESSDLGLGIGAGSRLAPGEVDMSLAMVTGLDLTNEIKMAKLDDLIRPEDWTSMYIKPLVGSAICAVSSLYSRCRLPGMGAPRGTCEFCTSSHKTAIVGVSVRYCTERSHRHGPQS